MHCSLMRHSSPYLNMLLVMGAILFYIYVVLCGVDDIASPDASLPGLCMVSLTCAGLDETCTIVFIFWLVGRATVQSRVRNKASE